jgi:enoyl-CoA hydratase
VQLRDFSRQGQDLITRIERLGKPVIAALNGFALGGGFELAMGCQLRLAADNARIGQPEVKLGLIPGFGGTQRLLRLAGRGAALELCLTGEPIDALRAFQLGLVNRVVAAADLASETAALAMRLSALAPQALRGVIDAIAYGGESALDQGLDYETQLFAVLASTDDMREGTSAFLEKRKPAFVGKSPGASGLGARPVAFRGGRRRRLRRCPRDNSGAEPENPLITSCAQSFTR